MRPARGIYKDCLSVDFRDKRRGACRKREISDRRWLARSPADRGGRGEFLDVMVKPAADPNEWLLTDLLGRSMGVVRRSDGGTFLVEPGGNAKLTMTGMRCGPFHSLDDALAAIETHTRGVCRREAAPDQ